MSVKIFVMTHKQFEVPDDPMYIPLHVGHKNAREEFGYLGDDTGENISEQNCYYAELSGVYWVWKNNKDVEIVGVCHYRRYLTSEKGYVFTETEYEQILSKYDIVTTKLLELPGSYRDGFRAHHNVSALDETGCVISKLYPEYYDTFVRLVHQNKTYFGNIMVAKKELFDAYCEWLFTIFFALQKRINLSFADDYHKRVFGFISEFLLYVWVTVNQCRAFECRVAVIGEKKETHEVTAKMATFFKNKDVIGAKAYFEKILKQRPDILMEASDINGECKLCLQAVSTANLELVSYRSCFLDYMEDYMQIIKYFRGLNSIASMSVQAVLTEKERQKSTAKTAYVKTIEEKSRGEITDSITFRTTEIAMRAAIRLYAPNQNCADRAFAHCKQLVKIQII